MIFQTKQGEEEEQIELDKKIEKSIARIKIYLAFNITIMLIYSVLALWPLIRTFKYFSTFLFVFCNILSFLMPAGLCKVTWEMLKKKPLDSRGALFALNLAFILQFFYFAITFAGGIKRWISKGRLLGSPLFLIIFALSFLVLVILGCFVTCKNFSLLGENTDPVAQERLEEAFQRFSSN